jgi:hypothetical protein
MKYRTIVIAIGGFRGKDKEMVPKEVSFVGTDMQWNHWTGSYLFKAPYSDRDIPAEVKKTNGWISKNMLGGLRWDDGNILFSKWKDLIRDICRNLSPFGVILAKGSEQVKLIRSLLPDVDDDGKMFPVLDLDIMGCPKAVDIVCTADNGGNDCVTLCGLPTHDSKVCSLGKCIRYTLWWEKKEREEDKESLDRKERSQQSLTRDMEQLEQKMKRMDLELRQRAVFLKDKRVYLEHREQMHKVAGHSLVSGGSGVSS